MKKYLLLAFVSCVLFSCSNDQEDNLSTDIPQSSKQKIQAVIGNTEYTFDNKEQLKTAIEEMEKKGETLKSVKVLNGTSTRASTNSVFTFSNGAKEITYNIGEGELGIYDYVDVVATSTINGNTAGFKIYKRPTWAFVTEYDVYTYMSRRLQANANVEGNDRAGCIILEQIGTGEWIFVNVIQKGSPRSNIFHCAGTKEYVLRFTPAGGSLTTESIVSTINGTLAGYYSYTNCIENKQYPSWLTIMGFGTNQLIVIVKPDPNPAMYPAPREFGFTIKQNGTNERFNITITQFHKYTTNYCTGGNFSI